MMCRPLEMSRLRGLNYLLVLALFGLLSACASAPSTSPSSFPSSSRYSMEHDAYPDEEVDVSGVPDAVPRWEPLSRGGNRSPYTVWGKQYYVMDTAKGYKEQGIASWYGKKFHGHLTSNGETYDMYAMSAAHRSLPLPSFVRVTNLENGRSVVVRVNDRGPFHADRLIDLSYAAAAKLGFVQKGTARVEVEAIYVEPGDGPQETPGVVPTTIAVNQMSQDVSNSSDGWFIQVGAYSSLDAAHRMKSQIRQAIQQPVLIHRVQQAGLTLHRVQVGPFPSEADAQRNKPQVEEAASGNVIIIRGTVAVEGAG